MFGTLMLCDSPVSIHGLCIEFTSFQQRSLGFVLPGR